MKRLAPTRCIQAICLIASSLPALSAAQSSNVTIYGLMDAAVRRATNVDAARNSRVTMEDGIFTGTRLGLRIREDLGGGLSAIGLMESGFDPSSGVSLQASPVADFGQTAAAPRFWGREVNVTLRQADRWGVTLGRQYTLAHQMTARFQPQGNPNSAAHSIFSSHHVARQDNVVKLDAKVAGVDVAASKTLGEVAGNDGSDAWAASVAYSGGPVFVAGYVQRLKNLADTEERRIVGLGGSYKFSPKATVFTGAMRRTNAVSLQTNNVWTLGTNYEVLPAVTLSAAYLHDKQSGSAALEGSRKLGYVTASYAFSKRTDVYAVVDRNLVAGGYATPAFMGTKGGQAGVVMALRHRF